MPDYFYDTSALVKRYHTELGTDNVDLIFADPTATHTVSQLAAVELLSAFAIKVRMGAVPASSILAASAKFQSDLAGRIIRVLRMRDEHYRIAEELLMRHSNLVYELWMHCIWLSHSTCISSGKWLTLLRPT